VSIGGGPGPAPCSLHRGLPTYIEASSERSAALDERFGFLHMDVLELPEGGPPVWLMRRPPPGASRAEA
jgi:hypothetical protein